jgi:hypothetical protein
MPWIVNYRGDVSEVQLEDESDRDFDTGIVLHETKDFYVFFLGLYPYKNIALFFYQARE